MLHIIILNHVLDTKGLIQWLGEYTLIRFYYKDPSMTCQNDDLETINIFDIDNFFLLHKNLFWNYKLVCLIGDVSVLVLCEHCMDPKWLENKWLLVLDYLITQLNLINLSWSDNQHDVTILAVYHLEVCLPLFTLENTPSVDLASSTWGIHLFARLKQARRS